MSTPTETLPLDDAQRFLRLLWELNHHVESRSKRMAAQLGVTFQQRTVLRLVGRFPGVTAGKLAATLHIDPSTLSTAVRRLEARGLLERRVDAKDRRRVCLGLTARGRAFDAPHPHTIENAVELTLARARRGQLEATEATLVALIRELARAEP